MVRLLGDSDGKGDAKEKYILLPSACSEKYAFRLLEDYRTKKSAGIKDPVFTKNRLKEVEKDIECW